MSKIEQALHVIAIDCCEHIKSKLSEIWASDLTLVDSSASEEPIERQAGVNLIIIGVARYPIRRFFLSRLRRLYPSAPVLILMREGAAAGEGDEQIRGEFMLSDKGPDDDLAIVRSLRRILPFEPCEHMSKANNYDVVREVVRVIYERYSDPKLDLDDVAKSLSISSKRLSRILNKDVGISFRQILRQTRIEEAKRLLALKRYSVKEIAARVGFADSHYFSRSFKELTGSSASEYRSHHPVL
jgi:AraC-like DNA-binding protein